MKNQVVRIYHNPDCSKSRTTLGLLEAHTPPAGTSRVEIEVIRYLEQPPDAATIKELAKLLACPVRNLIRSGDALCKELIRDHAYPIASLADDEAADLISNYPALLQRPLVVYQNRAVVGRPPENVLSLIP